MKIDVEIKSSKIDDRILQIVLKPLVLRLNWMEKDLIQPKNTTMFADFRMFFSFVKHVHPATFRSLIFSSLIDPQRKLQNEQKDKCERFSFRCDSKEKCVQEENLPVDLQLVRLGLLRFHFVLQSSPPGSIPDPQYLHNLLFLVR